MKLSTISMMALAYFLAPQVTHALGVGVTPSFLELSRENDTYTVTVVNTSDIPAVYELSAPDVPNITFSPHKFPLNPHESQLVSALYSSPVTKNHEYVIVARDKNANNFTARAGIKVHVIGAPPSPFVAAIGNSMHPMTLIMTGILLLGIAIGINLSKLNTKKS